MAQLLMAHLGSNDLLLVGHRGSGKSALIREFAVLTVPLLLIANFSSVVWLTWLVLQGYDIETQLLYKDLNQRDLMQVSTSNSFLL